MGQCDVNLHDHHHVPHDHQRLTVHHVIDFDGTHTTTDRQPSCARAENARGEHYTFVPVSSMPENNEPKIRLDFLQIIRSFSVDKKMNFKMYYELVK